MPMELNSSPSLALKDNMNTAGKGIMFYPLLAQRKRLKLEFLPVFTQYISEESILSQFQLSLMEHRDVFKAGCIFKQSFSQTPVSGLSIIITRPHPKADVTQNVRKDDLRGLF